MHEYDPTFTVNFTSQWDKEIADGTPVNQFLIDSIELRRAVRACKQQ